MKDLNVLELVEQSSDENINNFLQKIDSYFKLNIECENIVRDIDWIQYIESSLQYIDNIFRSPNRFIVNDDEIVKIELARRITVESIKHLSKNTNLIQDYNKKTGDVRPSKILNINKEESYNTYENRLIYTLIQNTKIFVMKKKEYLQKTFEMKQKQDQILEYFAKTQIFDQNVDIKIQLNSSLDQSKNIKDQYQKIITSIEDLETRINDITYSEVYKVLEKSHVSLITPPIKRTNLVLKNRNFQNAMKLWNYVQDNIDDKTKQIKEKKDFSNDQNVKKLLDEIASLIYLTVDSKTKNKITDQVTDRKEKEKLTNQLLERLIAINSDMSQQQILDMIASKYDTVIRKTIVDINDINDIFDQHIDKYLERIKD